MHRGRGSADGVRICKKCARVCTRVCIYKACCRKILIGYLYLSCVCVMRMRASTCTPCMHVCLSVPVPIHRVRMRVYANIYVCEHITHTRNSQPMFTYSIF